jgi:hypothetical protein
MMSGDVLYRFLVEFLDAFIWGGELVGEENLPEGGPAVFVSNHALALGPIAVAASLPVRLYPWVISDMLDWERAAAYLNKDFTEPQLHVPAPLSILISKLIAQASVRLLRRIEGIPVWHGEKALETYRISIDYLARGKSLLIFPEDPAQPLDEQCKMSPFQKGFARLGDLFYERTRQLLRFYPLAAHPGLRQVKLGKPIVFNPSNNVANERVRIRSVLESVIRNMFLEMTMQGYAGIPLPH